MVDHPLREREIAGSKPGRAMPKTLKMAPVATLVGAQHYKASTGYSFPNKYRNTNTTPQKVQKSLIIIIVCIHRRTVWKIDGHAKYFIILEYRNYYPSSQRLIYYSSFSPWIPVSIYKRRQTRIRSQYRRKPSPYILFQNSHSRET